MRRYKLLDEQIPDIVANAVKELGQGKQNITISLSTLLSLPAPTVKPIVIIKETAQLKMKALVNNCAKEIAWHGLVRIEDGKYVIYDILLYPQTITAATVNATDDYDLWLDALPDEQFNNIRMQGHSHVNMATFASGTDTEFYDKLVKHIRNYYIFMILNKQGAVFINIYDLADNKIYETADIEVQYESTMPDFNTWYATEYSRYVKEHSYTHTKEASNTFFGDFHLDDDYMARETYIGANRTPANISKATTKSYGGKRK